MKVSPGEKSRTPRRYQRPRSPSALRPRGQVCRYPGPSLFRVVVRDLHELERVPIGILEVDPPPAGEHTFVDGVHRAVEADAPPLELGLLRFDVVDEEGDMRSAAAVRLERLRGLTRRALVLEKLQHRVAEQQADL